jgi:hypothetical protein
VLGLAEPGSRGDPEPPLRWTVESTRNLAGELAAAGHPVSAPSVAVLLKGRGFSLQASSKTLEGARHPGRDAQFRYITDQALRHQQAGGPVIQRGRQEEGLRRVVARSE